MKHPIPDDALDDRVFFVGTTGGGKTVKPRDVFVRRVDAEMEDLVAVGVDASDFVLRHVPV